MTIPIFFEPSTLPLKEQIQISQGPQIRAGAADFILQAVRANRPIKFARFNDGELGAILRNTERISRGADTVTAAMSEALHRALSSVSPHALIGLPCPRCFPHHHEESEKIRSPRSAVTFATAMQNGWPHFFRNQLLRALTARSDGRVFWVGKAEHQTDAIDKVLGYPLNKVVVPARNGFSEAVTTIESLIQSASSDDLLLLSCGAAARVGALIDKPSPKLPSGPSILDIGTLFDDVTLGVQRGFHQTSKTVGRLCAGNKPTPRPTLKALVHSRLRWKRSDAPQTKESPLDK